MEVIQKQFDKLQLRALVIRSWNMGVIVLSFLSLLLLVISWGISVDAEGGKMKRRHVASIIGFIFALVTNAGDIIALRAEPNPLLLYGMQLFSAIALMINGVSVGMNTVITDLCAAGEAASVNIHCSAHWLEFFGGFLLCFCLGSVFLTTQQKIVVFVDKGILKGIGTRLSMQSVAAPPKV